jgi:hypothetical protein
MIRSALTCLFCFVSVTGEPRGELLLFLITFHYIIKSVTSLRTYLYFSTVLAGIMHLE